MRAKLLNDAAEKTFALIFDTGDEAKSGRFTQSAGG